MSNVFVKITTRQKNKIIKSKAFTLIKIAPALVGMLQSLGLIPQAEIRKRERPQKTL